MKVGLLPTLSWSVGSGRCLPKRFFKSNFTSGRQRLTAYSRPSQPSPGLKPLTQGFRQRMLRAEDLRTL